MTPELAEACRRALHVVTMDGAVQRGGRAMLFVREKLGWGRVARWLALPPFIWFVAAGYLVISRNRRFFSRWFYRA